MLSMALSIFLWVTTSLSLWCVLRDRVSVPYIIAGSMKVSMIHHFTNICVLWSLRKALYCSNLFQADVVLSTISLSIISLSNLSLSIDVNTQLKFLSIWIFLPILLWIWLKTKCLLAIHLSLPWFFSLGVQFELVLCLYYFFLYSVMFWCLKNSPMFDRIKGFL